MFAPRIIYDGFIFFQETVYIYTVVVLVQTPREWFKFKPLFLTNGSRFKIDDRNK